MKRHLVIGGLALGLLSGASSIALAASPHQVCKAKIFEQGVRYYQQSGAVAAIQLQTYKLATQSFKKLLAAYHGDKKPAVVSDIDETIFDNSPLFVRDMEHCHVYTSWDTWGQWERKGDPTLIPGSKAFLDYVNSQGVKIYYVTGRMPKNKSYTLASMRKLGLPQVSADNTIVIWSGSKATQFAKISKDYNIIMLLGDQLADFGATFEGKLTTAQRRALVMKNADNFGTKWIVLPDSAYGPWTHAKLNAWTVPMPKSVAKDN